MYTMRERGKGAVSDSADESSVSEGLLLLVQESSDSVSYHFITKSTNYFLKSEEFFFCLSESIGQYK